MSTVNVQGEPNMVYHSQGRDFRADSTGLITGIEYGSQILRDLLGCGCMVSLPMKAGNTVNRPAHPRLWEAYRDVDLGAVIVFDGAAWRSLGPAV